MDIGGILLGLLYVLLYIAVIVLVAFAIRWVIIFAVGAIDPNVDKWGRIVVGLLCAIVVVAWLLSQLGLVHVPFPVAHPIR
jgi:hypothetical protein